MTLLVSYHNTLNYSISLISCEDTYYNNPLKCILIVCVNGDEVLQLDIQEKTNRFRIQKLHDMLVSTYAQIMYPTSGTSFTHIPTTRLQAV